MKHADLVERVALVLFNAERVGRRMQPVDHIGSNNTAECNHWREVSRAALREAFEALKEPTPEMMGAAQSAWLADPLRRTTTLYAAMLSASPLNPER